MLNGWCIGMAIRLDSVIAATGLEPGDRFEVTPIGSTDRLDLPKVLGPGGYAIEHLEDQLGHSLKSMIDSAGQSLIVPNLHEVITRPVDALWLEYRAPGRFRLVVDWGTSAPTNGEVVTEQGVPIVLDPDDWSVIHEMNETPAGLETFDLALQAARLATHAGFDRLIALPLVRDMELLEHQVRTAKTVLQRFRGRAMLCDEVGLGKTIEAGLVLSELMIRGLVRSILVLVPPSLIEQWQGEMRRKFSIELISHDDPVFRERGADAWSEIRPRDRFDPYRQARAAPRGDPGAALGHDHRRRGPSPAQSQHSNLEVRERNPEAVHPAVDGHPGAEQSR